jgi:Fe2+ transport system protein FeoA
MKLSDLQPGQSARIAALALDGSLRQRLLELGFLKNAPVRLVRIAPLGDPIEFEVRGMRVTLRRTEADGIEVDL